MASRHSTNYIVTPYEKLFAESRLICCLLGSDPDEELAWNLNAVWPFKLAQLALDFRPSLFTFGFAQFFE
jgi:hypothetical protein